MSVFQRFTRTLRPTSFSAMSTFRAARPARSSKLDLNFFSSTTRLGLPRGPKNTFKPPTSSSNTSTPPPKWSLGPSTGALNMRLIYAIMGLNGGIFAYATYLQEQAKQGHPLPFIKFIQNFTLSTVGVFNEHRYWTAITSVFTHLGIMHIAGNMLSFFFMGQMLAVTPGFTPGKLAVLVLGSGLAGSAGWLYTTLKSGNYQQRALGFSGSVMGVGTVAAFMYPKTQFQIYGIIPAPLWALMLGYALYDGYFLNDRDSKVGHAGHLGGAAFGVLYYFAKVRGMRI